MDREDSFNYIEYRKNDSIENTDQEYLSQVSQYSNLDHIDKRSPVEYIQIYSQFFNVQELVDIRFVQSNLNIQSKLDHRLVLLNNNQGVKDLISFKKPAIYIMGHLFGSVVIKYEVVIGNYKMLLDLLNLNIMSPKKLNQIGQGGYGRIFKIFHEEKKIAIKRIDFNHIFDQKLKPQVIKINKIFIEDAICEFSIYKICSFYKIGPKVTDQLGFDLVCFIDSIQFYLQCCQPMTKLYNTLQLQLKIAVRLMHKINLVHKDIKPVNLLYSESYQRYVLCDFGISHSVEQPLGFKSRTYKQGSLMYMCEQMQALTQDKAGYVDLYFNDLYGLKEVLREFNKYQRVNKKQASSKQSSCPKRKNILYAIINFFYNLIKHQKYEIPQSMTQFIQQNFIQIIQFLKHILNSQIKELLEVRLGTKYRNQFRPIFQMQQTDQNHKIIFLIRVYGLTHQLFDQLNQFKKTDFIEDLKYLITVTCNNQYYDLNFCRNLKKLKKRNMELDLKVKRQMRKVESDKDNNNTEILLQLALELFFMKISQRKIIQNINLLADRIEELAKKSGICNYKIDIMRIMRIIFSNGRPEKSIELFIKKYPDKSCELYKSLIDYYNQQQDIMTLILYSKKHLEILKFQQIDTPTIQILDDLDRICSSYRILKSNTHSLHYTNLLEQFLRKFIRKYTFSQLSLSPISIDIYQYYATIAKCRNNLQEAVFNYQQAYKKQLQFNGEMSTISAKICLKLGAALLTIKRYKQAIQRLQMSLDIYKTYSNFYEYNLEVDYCYRSLSVAHFCLQDIRNFQYYYDKYIYQNCLILIQTSENYYQKYEFNYPNINIKELHKLQALNILVDKLRIDKQKSDLEVFKKYIVSFNICFQLFKRRKQFCKFLSSCNNFGNQQIIIRLNESLKQIQIPMGKFFVLILQICLRDPCRYKKQKTYLTTYLEFQKILQYFPIVNKLLLYELYNGIVFEYQNREEFKLYTKYLRKQLKVCSCTEMQDQYILCIQKLCKISTHNNQIRFICKQYQNYIKNYLTWQSNRYPSIMLFYLSIMKLDIFIIIKSYLEIFMKQQLYISFKNKVMLKTKKVQSICKIMLIQDLLNEAQLLTGMKLCKKYLFMKIKFGFFKHLKKNILKKKMTNMSRILN